MIAQDDAIVVIELTNVALRIRFIVGQVFANLDALEALAVETALCLLDRLLPGVALLRLCHGDRSRRFDSHGAREEPGLERSLLIAVR